MFNNSSKFYDLIYESKNYEKEVDYLIKEIKNYTKSKSILEYGSGSGNHALKFLEFGYNLEGVELSKEMHELALKKGLNSTNSNIIDFKSKKKFDCILSVFHVISYITDYDSLNLLFKNANKNLNNGGVFIFDIWFTPAVMHIFPAETKKEFIKEDYRVIRVSKPGVNVYTNCVDVNFKFEVFDYRDESSNVFYETHVMRHYSIPEITFFAKRNNFKLIKVEEMVSGKKPSKNTWAVTITLKKENEVFNFL